MTFTGGLSRIEGGVGTKMVRNNMVRLIVLCVLPGLIPWASYAADSVTDSSEYARKEVRAALDKWTRDFNDKNTDEVCGLFAPDLIANYGDYPEKSYDSICAQLKSSLANPKMTFRYSLEIKEIIVSGDLAVVRLIWTLTVTDADNKAVETTKDRGIDVFRRQADGSWKISRYIAYPMKES